MLDDLIKERHKKLELIREAGIDPYPARVKRTSNIAEALFGFDNLEKAKKAVSLTGRLRSVRDMGKIVFTDLEDSSAKIQVVLKDDTLGNFEFWQKVLDLGDFISVTGILFTT